MKKLENTYLLLCFGCVLILLTGCDLQKDIEVPLPPYESKLVVECYLEYNKNLKVAVTESVSYFSGPKLPDVEHAKVSISFNDRTETLAYKPTIDTVNQKVYNYVSNRRVRASDTTDFFLQIEDDLGRKVTGETRFLPFVPIKQIEWKYNKDSVAFLLIHFDDDPAVTNYYRIQIFKDSLNKKADMDFSLDDTFSTNNEITLGTGYNFREGNTVYVNLYHIEKSYYDFLQSVESATNANGNPFAQPAQIKSSVQGGIGIFTTLVYHQREIFIE